MGVYQQNGKWGFDYRYNGRRFRQFDYDDKAAAEIAYGKRRDDIRSGKHPEEASAVKVVLFEDHARRCWDLHFSGKRAARWTKGVIFTNLMDHFQGRTVSGIRPLDIQEYMSKRRAEGAAPATVMGERAVLSKMMTFALRWGNRTDNPIRGTEPLEVLNQRDRTMTAEEGEKILGDPKLPAHLRLAVIISLETGARLTEALTLAWADVDFDARTIMFRQTNTKSGRARSVALTDYLAAALREARSARKVRSFDPGSEAVVTFNGEPVKRLTTAWRTACRRAGVKNLHFHDLRRTFAHTLYRDGGHLAAVQAYLGHQDTTTTQRYLGVKAPMIEASAPLIGGWRKAVATDLPRKAGS